ncbi:MAG: DUF922 domain-containing Zn-dependent protease [Pseudodesulfovibrio sp.]
MNKYSFPLKFLLTLVLALLVFTTTSFLPTTTWAEVKVIERTKFYYVEGRTPKQLIESMKAHNSLGSNGHVITASAKPNYRFQYSWASNGKRCTIKDVTIKLHIIYRFPKSKGLRLPSKTQAWWDELLVRTMEHELIHGEIAEFYAGKLQEMFLDTSIGCKNFEKKIGIRIERILRKMYVKQAGYDSQTTHGINQHKYIGISNIPRR